MWKCCYPEPKITASTNLVQFLKHLQKGEKLDHSNSVCYLPFLIVCRPRRGSITGSMISSRFSMRTVSPATTACSITSTYLEQHLRLIYKNCRNCSTVIISELLLNKFTHPRGLKQASTKETLTLSAPD